MHLSKAPVVVKIGIFKLRIVENRVQYASQVYLKKKKTPEECKGVANFLKNIILDFKKATLVTNATE